MLKRQFIQTIPILILAIACNRKNKALDKKIAFEFPIIIDHFENRNLKSTNKNWLTDCNHPPYYFGNLNDSIALDRHIRPLISPPLPPASDTSKWNSEHPKGKFDLYFPYNMENHNFKSIDSVQLLIKIDTSQFINNEGKKSFPVLIENISDDTVNIGYRNHISITTEALSKNGEWKPIEKQLSFMCGVGLNSIILPPNEIVLTSQLIYSGSFKTKLRIKLGSNYSEEFLGEINVSQFENQ